MSKIPKSEWTATEKRFAKLVERTTEPGGLGRINAMFALVKLQKQLGKEVMDAMWERIK